MKFIVILAVLAGLAYGVKYAYDNGYDNGYIDKLSASFNNTVRHVSDYATDKAVKEADFSDFGK